MYTQSEKRELNRERERFQSSKKANILFSAEEEKKKKQFLLSKTAK